MAGAGAAAVGYENAALNAAETIDTHPQKLHSLIDGEWRPHRHAAVYRVSPERRIVAGIPDGDAAIFAGLLDTLDGPFHLLYVLHTPRGEASPGRYQSPPLSKTEVSDWLREFTDFLRADARFDLWAHDPQANATLVWDRHNLLFAYGPLDRFEAALRERGFAEGDAIVPSPHEHHYRPEYDDDARRLIASQTWSYSPLRPEDEQ